MRYQFKVIIDIENEYFFNKMKEALMFEYIDDSAIGVYFYVMNRKLDLNGKCVINKEGNYVGSDSEEFDVTYTLWFLNNNSPFNIFKPSYVKGASFILSDREYKGKGVITLKDDENPFHELFKKTSDLIKKRTLERMITFKK